MLSRYVATAILLCSELNSKTFIKTYSEDSLGWKRIAKYAGENLTVAQGSLGNSALIFLRTVSNNSATMTAIIIFESAYQVSSFKLLSTKGSAIISKIRHVIDTNSNTAYIEIYYNANNYNGFTVSMPCNIDGANLVAWKPTDGESTEETVEGVTVMSSLDLTA